MGKFTYKLSAYFKAAGVEELPDGFHECLLEFTPRKTQISGLNRCVTKPKWGLYDEAGTGKSYVLYGTALYYAQWGNRIVAIMPPILFKQFRDNLYYQFRGSDLSIKAAIFGPGCGTKNKDGKTKRDIVFETLDETGVNMIILSYEMFVKERRRLKEHDFNVVLTDEAHKLRNSESDFFTSVYDYTESDEDTVLIVATGTPIFHTSIDGYAMTNLVSRGTYKSLRSFKRQHCIIQSFRMPKVIRGRKRMIRVENIVGFKNLDLLHINMYKNARRVTKDQALSLKKPTIAFVDVEMSAAHKKLYSTLANERMLELPDDKLLIAKEATTLREQLMQIACNPHLYTDKKVQDNLFEMFYEKLIEALGSSKVVVYAHHNVTLEGLQDRLEEFSPALVYGGARRTASSNQKDIDRFLNEDACKVLLAHPQSAGVGLNLEGACHYAFFYEPTPIHGQFSQAMDRVYRGEQSRAVVVLLFRLLGTVYPKMVKIMLDNNESAGIVNCDKSTFSQWVYGDESR